MPVWLVTGTSQGIGLELTKQLAATPTSANTVIATCRAPERAAALAALASAHSNMHIVSLDVLSADSVQAAVAATQTILGDRGVDYLINNAGIGHRGGIDTAATEMLELMFQTHVVGTLRVFRAFEPLVRAGARRVVVNVSSVCGSIGCEVGPVDAAYSIAKAGLNMLTYKMVKQYPDLVIFAFEPGHINTRMGGDHAPLTVATSVPKHITVFESATLATHAGRFIDLDGNELPW